MDSAVKQKAGSPRWKQWDMLTFYIQEKKSPQDDTKHFVLKTKTTTFLQGFYYHIVYINICT